MGMHQNLPALTTSRADIEAMIELLIARLDDMDGDPDCETCDTEDDFALSWLTLGNFTEPGCPLIDGTEDDDPAEDEDDDECLAGDDGCRRIQRAGSLYFGEAADELFAVPPVYGIDQTRGPLNAKQAIACRPAQGRRIWPPAAPPGQHLHASPSPATSDHERIYHEHRTR